jgi:hypothetical protein
MLRRHPSIYVNDELHKGALEHFTPIRELFIYSADSVLKAETPPGFTNQDVRFTRLHWTTAATLVLPKDFGQAVKL